MDLQYKERIGQQQSRLTSEIEDLRDLLQDAERGRDKYHEEVTFFLFDWGFIYFFIIVFLIL